MLNTTQQIQKQLATSLELICEHDFPREWDTLLPVITPYYSLYLPFVRNWLRDLKLVIIRLLMEY